MASLTTDDTLLTLWQTINTAENCADFRALWNKCTIHTQFSPVRGFVRKLIIQTLSYKEPTSSLQIVTSKITGWFFNAALNTEAQKYYFRVCAPWIAHQWNCSATSANTIKAVANSVFINSVNGSMTNRFTTTPTAKEDIMDNTPVKGTAALKYCPAVETITYIFGVPAKDVSVDVAYEAIYNLEAEIDKLNSLRNKPTAVSQQIEKLNSDILAIIAVLDAREQAA